MANLLPRSRTADPFPAFSEEQYARFEDRLRSVCGLRLESRGSGSDHARLSEIFSVELEELEQSPSLEAAHDLLDRIDRERQGLLPESGVTASPVGGEWLCYWPGRSLETGEAEIASRGFFDAFDRPPLGFWVEAVGRRQDRSEAIEVAILCWVPAAECARARAGQEACGARTLAFLASVSDELLGQIRDRLSVD